MDALAPRTIRVYQSCWTAFESWCGLQARVALPAAPSTVACFLFDMGKRLSVSALYVHRAAIAWMHCRHGLYPPPTRAGVVERTLLSEGRPAPAFEEPDHASRAGAAPRARRPDDAHRHAWAETGWCELAPPGRAAGRGRGPPSSLRCSCPRA